jgi:hypothetical protein
MNLVIFVGYGSGKISQYFLNILIRYRTKNTTVKYFSGRELLLEYLQDIHKNFKKIIICPIYCEDTPLKRTFKIDLAVYIEKICTNFDNTVIIHNSKIGNILGDKAKTNLFLTLRGIKCPKMITNANHNGPVFVNAKTSSGALTHVLAPNADINTKMYNTEFIESTFIFNENKYYVCVRLMCIEENIVDIHLRFRDSKENNPNVHASNTPIDAELQNMYYESKVLPNYEQLKCLARDVGKTMGLGFYAHDIVLCDKTGEFYLLESSFKFDVSLSFKSYLSEIIPNIKHEKSIKESAEHSAQLFYSIIENKYN